MKSLLIPYGHPAMLVGRDISDIIASAYPDFPDLLLFMFEQTTEGLVINCTDIFYQTYPELFI
jgi:hypothetical protein